MLVENPVLLGEKFAPYGSIFTLDGKTYKTLDVKPHGELEVLQLDESGKPISNNPILLNGDIQITDQPNIVLI